MTDKPVWELLLEGSFVIWGTEVKEIAGTRLKSNFPEAMFLADLCRIAQEHEFRGGQCFPSIYPGKNGALKVGWVLQMPDFKDTTLLETITSYQGPTNSTIPKPFVLTLPNFTNREFQLPEELISSWDRELIDRAYFRDS